MLESREYGGMLPQKCFDFQTSGNAIDLLHYESKNEAAVTNQYNTTEPHLNN